MKNPLKIIQKIMNIYMVMSDMGLEYIFLALVRSLYSSTISFIPWKKDNPKIKDDDTVIIFGDILTDEELHSFKEFKHISFKSANPIQDLMEFLLQKNIINLDTKLVFRSRHRKLMDILELYFSRRNTASIGPLDIGMNNIQTDIPIENRYFNLFCGYLQLEDVLKFGSTLMESKLNAVKEHVSKNSKVDFFKNGTKFAITDARESINMVHEELRRFYPDCDVTIVSALQFKAGEEDKIVYFLRSWNDNVNVKEIVGVHGCGIKTFAVTHKNINTTLD